MEYISLEQARSLSPLTLAFYGDAVYEVMVRGKIISLGSAPSAKLHKKAVDKVRASYQAKAADKILHLLNEAEADILKRGRNANTGTIPKSSTPAEYHKATALEALFGYLCLIGDNDRLEQLFEVVYNEESETC